MEIKVQAANGSYPIRIQNGALEQVGDFLPRSGKTMIVTDSGVPENYVQTVANACCRPVVFSFPMGEASKNLTTYGQLLSAMLEHGFTRSDCVVAVGGGVVGDLAGFAAACYMRGVAFYNIPTTLLSQVDSSIGGKTAVDHGGVKNAVGAFYPPKGVLIDPTVLQTLSPRQFAAGMAEVIKMAATSDEKLFSLLETAEDINAVLPEVIRRALCIKQSVVEQDPLENGLRRVLNFGHTLGHGVESHSKGALLHGECVALGMPPMCGKAFRPRMQMILQKYRLPTTVAYTAEDLRPYVIHDKKATGTAITAVLVEAPGSFRFAELTPEELLKRWECAE